MPLTAEGTFKIDGRGKTGRLYIPAALVRDSRFPLTEGKVQFTICTDNECGVTTICVKPIAFEETLIIEGTIKKKK